MTRVSFAFLPQYREFGSSSILLLTSHDLSLYGPVPTGFCVANVPVGWKTPFASTVPASASYFFSAVGLAIPKFGSASAARNDVDRRVSRSVTVYLPFALHPL